MEKYLILITSTLVGILCSNNRKSSIRRYSIKALKIFFTSTFRSTTLRISSGSLWGVTSQLEMFFNFDPLFCILHLYLRSFLSLNLLNHRFFSLSILKSWYEFKTVVLIFEFGIFLIVIIPSYNTSWNLLQAPSKVNKFKPV